jgi:hypothetical protein
VGAIVATAVALLVPTASAHAAPRSTLRHAGATVQFRPSLVASDLRDSAGRPTLVGYFAPQASSSRDATRFFALGSAQLHIVGLTCGSVAGVRRFARSVHAASGTLIAVTAGCTPRLNAAFDGIVRDRLTGLSGVKLLDGRGKLLRFSYEQQITLRAAGLDPSSGSLAWLGFDDGSYDNTSLYADDTPQPQPQLRKTACNDLPAIGNVFPTCNYSLGAFTAQNKPLLVVAFAKYCPTCQEGKADFNYQTWADQHPAVQLVGLTCDDPTTAWMWAQRHGWKFPVLANGSTVLKGGYADYGACFDDVYTPLGLAWWGDVASPGGGVDVYGFEVAVGL